MKLFVDASVKSVLSESLAGVAPDVALVFVEALSDSYGSHSKRGGLATALELARENEKVLLVGWESPAGYANDVRWHACLAYPTVDFARSPLSIRQIADMACQCPANRRPADPLALRLVDLKAEVDVIGTLKHDLSSFDQRPEDVQTRFEDQARRLFGNKTLEELKKLVGEANAKLPVSVLTGESFPDVFVDVEGTLIKGGVINTGLVAKLEQLSKERPVTIWTGGDPDSLGKELHLAGIPYKVISKHLFRGLAVGTAFDDLPYERFQELYGVEVEEYIRV